MQKKRFATTLVLICGSALLSACSFSKGTAESNVFTVSYYDDSAEPVLVGYAYVIKGKEANMRSVEGVDYDKLSHSGALPSAIGKHFVFDGFAGTYEDGTQIDLKSIQASCSVYAQFVEAEYSLTYTFKNGAISLRDADNNLIKGTAKFGDPFVFADLGIDSSSLEYTVPRYGYQYGLTGFTIDADSSKTTITDSMLKWESGDAVPETPSPVGTIFVSTNNMNNNPSYETYFSTQTQWVSLGKLSENLKISFSCSFEEEEKDFQVSVVKNGTLIGTVPAKYAVEEITVSQIGEDIVVSNSRGISVSCSGDKYSAKYIKFNSETADRIQENYSERDVELKHIMGDCVITIE